MIDEIKYPRRCPRWERCSVNRCPLSPPEIREHQRIDRCDPEQVCKASLESRLKIVAEAKAEGVDLGDGMTDRERKAVESGKATVESINADFARKAAANAQKAADMRSLRARQTGKTGGEDKETTADPVPASIEPA